VTEFSRQCIDAKILGYSRLRFLKFDLGKFTGKLSLLAKIEDDMRKILDVIEKDDAKKGIRTIIVIDYDEMEKEIPMTRMAKILPRPCRSPSTSASL